ncbi:TonB family protein [Serratia sp. Se-PFBMAAmG]|nr:TonB family protein [Serratia sp. Se-PFBMAAmG]
MTSLTFAHPQLQPRWPAWREHGAALGTAVALHAGLAYLLFNLSQAPVLPPAPAAVIQTQLVELPRPAPIPVPEPVAATPPALAEPTPVAKPAPAPPVVDEAALARKRVQQERREQQRVEQAQREVERREQLARDKQLQAEAERARMERERQARDAEAERQAAAARARAEADAASRQYLPIAKEAPDYPQRALDRRIEGECTVVYTVDATGRVNDPQVVGNCHPLFIKPSLAAAKRFRYQPRVVNGQAVAVANVKNTFTYRIQ